ncbi:hypothetical protein NC653_028902 [Populus alba x Populus x berolinensis]|uniref:Uncharacterized protein n=1 Tax=Populus alba x Populus x berolinensis TaxID=444605 RepID=A0AAD6M0T4_9ROSI|nr:hypothetical protein NC653_028902 [Populus alba x Populus x berolinensis]
MVLSENDSTFSSILSFFEKDSKSKICGNITTFLMSICCQHIFISDASADYGNLSEPRILNALDPSQSGKLINLELRGIDSQGLLTCVTQQRVESRASKHISIDSYNQ